MKRQKMKLKSIVISALVSFIIAAPPTNQVDKTQKQTNQLEEKLRIFEKETKNDLLDLKDTTRRIEKKILEVLETLKLSVCDDGWIFNENNRKCYKLLKLAKNWPDAQMYCKEQGLNGDLASIPNIETQKFLESFLTKTMIQHGLWIGGKKNPSGEWSWTDGNIWSYENWGTGWTGRDRDVLRFHYDYEWCGYTYTTTDSSWFLCQHSVY